MDHREHAMNRHTDPFHRRESFHSSNLTASAAQERRRKQALEAQKQRRVHAIEAARNFSTSSSRDLFDLEDISISGSADSSPPSSDVELRPEGTEGVDRTPLPQISKQKRKTHQSVRFRSWAKNLLCQAETLDLREGLLPYGLEQDYRLTVVPTGKRCLCVTTNDTNGKNTILYSRVAGRTLARLRTTLPGDCLLDVVWDRDLSILWVLDTCKWRGAYFVECEADLRAFFTQSKLSELSTQYYIPPSSLPPDSPALTTNPSLIPLLVVPAPTYSSPLNPSTLLPILNSIATPSSYPIKVLLPSNTTPSGTTITTGGGGGGGGGLIEETTISVPFEPTGFMLYHRQSHYESGLTPLVNWVPLKVIERGREEFEGVERFKQLVERWRDTVVVTRGGGGPIPNDRNRDEEVFSKPGSWQEGEESVEMLDPFTRDSLPPFSSSSGGDFTTLRA